MLTFGVQLPFMLARFVGVENPEQAMALVQKMAQAQTPDALMIAADIVTAAMNLLLRPLLAAAFVVLYYDAKARSGRVNERSQLEVRRLEPVQSSRDVVRFPRRRAIPDAWLKSRARVE